MTFVASLSAAKTYADHFPCRAFRGRKAWYEASVFISGMAARAIPESIDFDEIEYVSSRQSESRYLNLIKVNDCGGREPVDVIRVSTHPSCQWPDGSYIDFSPAIVFADEWLVIDENDARQLVGDFFNDGLN